MEVLSRELMSSDWNWGMHSGDSEKGALGAGNLEGSVGDQTFA